MTKKSTKNKLDKIVGNWCRTIRNGGKCERCGSRGNNSRDIQWAHLKSRRYLSVRWSEDNCFCLCAKCHRWFTDNPDDFYKWIEKHHSEQYERLMTQFRAVNPMNEMQMEKLLEEWQEILKNIKAK